MRSRFSIFLLVTLVGTAAVIAVYTVKLHQAQHSMLEETMRESRARAMNLLATKIEQALNDVVNPPFIYINSGIDPPDSPLFFNNLKAAFPMLSTVLILGEDYQIAQRFPQPKTSTELAFIDWLTKRVELEKTKLLSSGRGIWTFTETVADNPVLFAIQAARRPNKSNAWILITYDLRKILTSNINPLLDSFAKETPGTIRLQDSDSEWDDEALNWPVGHNLPGWMLTFHASEEEEAELVEQQDRLYVSMTATVLIMLTLAGYALWREYNREKSVVELRKQFIANVSHELRTPITLIRMYAETLFLRRITESERMHHYHQVILQESERLSAMVDTVLNFAQMEKSKPVFVLNETDLAQSLHQTVDIYQGQFAHRGAKLKLEIDDELPGVLHDRNAITQIILNLVDNAIKYGDIKQAITISLRRRQNNVVLSVSDRGRGITSFDRKRLVKPFERGVTENQQTGAGLGLSLVKEIAKIHNANLELSDNESGQGLNVQIIFPVATREK